MRKIQEHVEGLFKTLPESERKEQLMQEIIQNLQEKVNDLMAQGKAEEDAVNKAIVEFGDITDIQAELDLPTPRRGNTPGLDLAFSFWGSGLIIALAVFINLYYTPGIIWFVYPVFGVLWWPLSMYFRWLRRR